MTTDLAFGVRRKVFGRAHRDGRPVQIKAIQGKVGTPQGAIEEVYNEPGAVAWNAAGRMQ